MAKPKGNRRPYTPATIWDTGPNTAAQRAGKVIEAATWRDPETGKEVNPNGVKRSRRIDVVEMYARKGILDRRQLAAALALRCAYEGTYKSPPAIKKLQVDVSPKPDHFVAILMDRIGRFSDVMVLVPKRHREIIDCVVLENRTPGWLRKYRGPRYRRGIERMQEALADLADALDV